MLANLPNTLDPSSMAISTEQNYHLNDSCSSVYTEFCVLAVTYGKNLHGSIRASIPSMIFPMVVWADQNTSSAPTLVFGFGKPHLDALSATPMRLNGNKNDCMADSAILVASSVVKTSPVRGVTISGLNSINGIP